MARFFALGLLVMAGCTAERPANSGCNDTDITFQKCPPPDGLDPLGPRSGQP